jgi:type II secretory pathway pseudopilin PulG
MVIAVVLTVVSTVSNSSSAAIMIQQQKLQQQTAYAATKGTSGSSGDGIILDSRDNITEGLVNSTQSGSNNNNTSGISLGDDTSGDNNSCRRERGGELGARAGELGLSSKFCN